MGTLPFIFGNRNEQSIVYFDDAVIYPITMSVLKRQFTFKHIHIISEISQKKK
jgi:hypothetical protein